jgi:hypothetical protein
MTTKTIYGTTNVVRAAPQLRLEYDAVLGAEVGAGSLGGLSVAVAGTEIRVLADDRVRVNDAEESVDPGTGSVRVTGGVGVLGSVNVGGSLGVSVGSALRTVTLTLGATPATLTKVDADVTLAAVADDRAATQAAAKSYGALTKLVGMEYNAVRVISYSAGVTATTVGNLRMLRMADATTASIYMNAELPHGAKLDSASPIFPVVRFSLATAPVAGDSVSLRVYWWLCSGDGNTFADMYASYGGWVTGTFPVTGVAVDQVMEVAFTSIDPSAFSRPILMQLRLQRWTDTYAGSINFYGLGVRYVRDKFGYGDGSVFALGDVVPDAAPLDAAPSDTGVPVE